MESSLQRIKRRREEEMYPKGSPKYNMQQVAKKKKSPKATTKIKKKKSPKATKKGSPSVDKPRAQWNPSLEKSLVDVLHEHNNDYHRGQNGWTTEAWSRMLAIFNEKHPHIHFIKNQIQYKEKELKTFHRSLKEARKQSGVGWNESMCMLVAEASLWDNLRVTCGEKIKDSTQNPFLCMILSQNCTMDTQLRERTTSHQQVSQLIWIVMMRRIVKMWRKGNLCSQMMMMRCRILMEGR